MLTIAVIKAYSVEIDIVTVALARDKRRCETSFSRDNIAFALLSFHATTMTHASKLSSYNSIAGSVTAENHNVDVLKYTVTSAIPNSPHLSCLPTEKPTRKLKVLFVFTGTGSWSEAECQAVENSTAAWLILAMSGESRDYKIDTNLWIQRKNRTDLFLCVPANFFCFCF